MNFSSFNSLSGPELQELYYSCCGSTKFAEQMSASHPLESENRMIETAQQIWYDTCAEADWLEAFSQHPQIGDLDSLKKKFAGTEQSAVAGAQLGTLQELSDLNKAYKEKFGFIFIICATGKPVDVMVRTLKARLQNTRNEELAIAMAEQHKITILRLMKQMSEADWSSLPVSQLTTHVLDTSVGMPGENILVQLNSSIDGSWNCSAIGVTNADGRVSDLLPQGVVLSPGNYQLVFDSAGYYENRKTSTFYPKVEIQFTITGPQHYHVPLLLNPFGYSTYRGS